MHCVLLRIDVGLAVFNVLEVHPRATAQTAAQFLDSLLARMPFPVAALQVDGGSEFAAPFEQACQQRQLPLLVLPLPLPQTEWPCRTRSSHAQRGSLRGHSRPLSLPELSRQLLAWEHTYNTVRPHQVLGYATSLRISSTLRQFQS
jgi:putative transposase